MIIAIEKQVFNQKYKKPKRITQLTLKITYIMLYFKDFFNRFDEI